jgi:tetrapyrrole methylase family protein/MazG family protein
MSRFLRLNRIQLLEGSFDLASLPTEEPLFLAWPDQKLEEMLASKGIPVSVLTGDEIPSHGTLILNERPLYDLVYLSNRLLGPGGCPWDQAQTHESLKRYLLEETYEVLDAIDSGSDEKLCEELGDVLLQPLMHAAMKEMAGGFTIDDVAFRVVDKLVHRHPHVFGSVAVENVDDVLRNWDALKKKEKGEESPSILSGVPKWMASLLRAYEVSKRAQRSGFEWPEIEAVFEKLHEEEGELRAALDSGDQEAVESELGDILFTVVNISRWAKVEPEEALRKMVNRFTLRFQAMELSARKPLNELTPEEWDELWESAKRAQALL